MTVLVEDYPHRTGEHCASTALRNILAHHGSEFSEGMVFGLASGLGFFYLQSEGLSPTRMFHGRTLSLENDFGLNTGIPFVDRAEPDDERAWAELRARIDAGEAVMVATDTFYLDYHDSTSHFPGHRCVVVGYDDDSERVLIADRAFDEYQRCSYEELRRARNADDYPMPCHNQFGDRQGPLEFTRPLGDAIRDSLRRTALGMLEPVAHHPSGIPAMRVLAKDFARWRHVDDWSWAARFGYQVVIKRGAGGSFFRTLYADFLREAADEVPEIARDVPAARMDTIAAKWRDLAAVLKDQSEREDCDPELFVRAGTLVGELADLEERFFDDVLELPA